MSIKEVDAAAQVGMCPDGELNTQLSVTGQCSDPLNHTRQSSSVFQGTAVKQKAHWTVCGWHLGLPHSSPHTAHAALTAKGKKQRATFTFLESTAAMNSSKWICRFKGVTLKS